MASAGVWPVVILACGHVASAEEAMRQNGQLFCRFCACWQDKRED